MLGDRACGLVCCYLVCCYLVCCYLVLLLQGALKMKNCRRTLVLAATLLVALAGVACAEPTQSSPPSQPAASFWSWLTGTPDAAPAKPRPAPVAASAPEAAKPRPSPPAQQTTSFWSWLTGTTAAPAKPRPAAVTASGPETANP